jgi:hypothetical protein
MGDIVNLRRVRKDRKRRDADVTASANRLAFGRTKAERNLTEARNDLDARRIDGHLRETAGTDTETPSA